MTGGNQWDPAICIDKLMAFLLEASFSKGTDNLIDQLLINQTVLETVCF
jgi:hypothetical protein